MNQREKQKAGTRSQILGSAERHLKTEGLSAASVSDIMADAGLTVGGFYAHFASKDELADATVRHAMSERRRMFLDRFEGLNWSDRISSALHEYLQSAHRDNPATGCPMSTAAIEAARSEVTAPAFVEEFKGFVEAFESGRGSTGPPAPREAAIGTLALMVGGMILARAAKGTVFSDEILQTVDAYGQAALGNLASKWAKPSGQTHGGDK